MNKLRWLLLTTFLIGSGTAGYFAVEANSESGEFLDISHTGAHASLFEEYHDIYIGKQLRWTGDQMPTVQDINIIKDDGTVLSSGDESIHIELFFDPHNETDLFYGFSPDMREIVGDYERPNDFKLTERTTTIVFKVTLHETNYQFDLDYLQIEYEVNDQEEAQEIPLRSFVFHH
ncbi:hypothetical protein [Alkalibacillus haloalkaliphilus]|uniref:hypothetical protein n=1 Tax=Alkalibacillus haloalkaliphilus TaxID=94136 RepID=UPI0029362E0D|nr:hypothetical protein [Alkalibacillus haloalkaliphilus]MDV2581283.1 hypothetical protein [Alkalibacillus haloalkaliphilus]